MNKKSQNGEHFRKCEAIVSAYKRLDSIGLNRGASGNISMKTNNGFLITPSGVNVEKMRLNDMVELNLQANKLQMRFRAAGYMTCTCKQAHGRA